jgi:hypothetical protein
MRARIEGLLEQRLGEVHVLRILVDCPQLEST